MSSACPTPPTHPPTHLLTLPHARTPAPACLVSCSPFTIGLPHILQAAALPVEPSASSSSSGAGEAEAAAELKLDGVAAATEAPPVAATDGTEQEAEDKAAREQEERAAEAAEQATQAELKRVSSVAEKAHTM